VTREASERGAHRLRHLLLRLVSRARQLFVDRRLIAAARLEAVLLGAGPPDALIRAAHVDDLSELVVEERVERRRERDGLELAL